MPITMNPKKINKRGMTIIELLAYTALIGVVFGLFSGILRQISKSYDDINGQGAIISEANDIMRLIMATSKTFTPDFVSVCEDDAAGLLCIEVIQQNEITISEKGLIIYKPLEEQIHKRLEIKDQNIYLDGLQLNKGQFKIDMEKSSITLSCVNADGIYLGYCQQAIIHLDLWIGRVNKDGTIPKSIQFKSEISTY